MPRATLESLFGGNGKQKPQQPTLDQIFASDQKRSPIKQIFSAEPGEEPIRIRGDKAVAFDIAGFLGKKALRHQIQKMGQYNRSAVTGALRAAENVVRIPRFLLEAALSASASPIDGPQVTPFRAPKAPTPRIFQGNPVERVFADMAKETDVFHQKYGPKPEEMQSFIQESIKQGKRPDQKDLDRFVRDKSLNLEKLVGAGNYPEAANYIGHQVLLNAPYMLTTLGLTIATGGASPALLGFATAYGAAQQYGEIEERPDISQQEKLEASWLSGLAEGIPEMVSARVFPYAVRLFKTVGTKAGKAAIVGGLNRAVASLKAVGSPILSEAAEEFVTEIAQNMVTQHYAIEDGITRKEVLRRATEAAVIGGVSGGLFHVPASALLGLQRAESTKEMTREQLVQMHAEITLQLKGIEGLKPPESVTADAIAALDQIEKMLARETHQDEGATNFEENIIPEIAAETIVDQAERGWDPAENTRLHQELAEVIQNEADTLREANELGRVTGKGANLYLTPEGKTLRFQSVLLKMPDGSIPETDQDYVALARFRLEKGQGQESSLDEYKAVKFLLENGKVVKAEEIVNLASEENIALKEGATAYGDVAEAVAVAQSKATWYQQLSSRRKALIQQTWAKIKARGWVDLRGEILEDPGQIATALSIFRNPSIEQFHALYLDGENRVIAHTMITSGRVDGVEPKDAEVYFKIGDRARRTGAAKVVLLHNHPSGRAQPSKEDVAMTVAMARRVPLGVNLSHIVIDDGEYSAITPTGTDSKIEFGEFDLSRSYDLARGEQIQDPDDIAQLFRTVQLGQNNASLVLMDKGNRVLGIENIPGSWLGKKMSANLNEIIRDKLKEYGAGSYVITSAQEEIKNLSPALLPPRVLDVIQVTDDGSFESVREKSVGYFGSRVPDPTPKAKRLFEEGAPYGKQWFTDAEQAIEERMPARAPREQVEGILRSWGVKTAELEDTGLSEFLLSKETFTKQEVIDFIRANQIEVREVLRGDYENLLTSESDTLQMRQTMEDQLTRMYSSDVDKAAWENYDAGGKEFLQEKYPNEIAQYERLVAKHIEASERIRESGVTGPTKFASHQLPGGENYREVLLTLPSAESTPVQTKDGKWTLDVGQGQTMGVYETEAAAIEGAKKWGQTGFRGGHFDEPNILAHVRLNDRTDSEGRKILFIEELQSDWGQALRRGKDVPKMPFAKIWHELALKRILRMATEEGYDAIGWTTGEQQTDRYDLSKRLMEVKIGPGGRSHVLDIDAWDKSGEHVIRQSDIPKEKLQDYIGKELAERALREGALQQVKSYGGLDLKVGGEGMKAFYDRMIPQFLNKYTKKWGGRVTETTIESKIGKQDVRYTPNFEVRTALRKNDNLGFDSTTQALEAILTHPDFAQRWDVPRVDALIIEGWREDQVGALERPPVHALEITPSMKYDITMKGQSMFREAPEPYGREIDRDKLERLRKATAKAKEVLTQYEQKNLEQAHETIQSKPAKERISARASLSKFVTNVRTSFISAFLPVKQMEREVYKMAGETQPRLDIARKLEQVAGARGKAEADIVEFEREVLKPIKAHYDDFNVYLFLNRTIDRLKTGLDAQTQQMFFFKNPRRVGGWTVERAEAALRGLQKKIGVYEYARLEAAAAVFQRHTEKSLLLQVQSGRMSHELFNTIKGMNDFYAPFKVMKYFEEMESIKGSAGRRIATTTQLTKAIVGITDEDFKIQDILQATAEQIYKSRILAEKNLKMNEVAKLTLLDKEGALIRQLEPGEDTREGYSEVSFFTDGIKVSYEMPEAVAEPLNGLNQTQTGQFAKVLAVAAVPMRMGATSANLAFQVVNLVFADLPRSSLVSKYGVTKAEDLIRFPLEFIYSFYTSFGANVFGQDNELYMNFLKSGSANSTIARVLRPAAFKPRLLGRKIYDPRNILETMDHISNAIEETNKILGFKRALRMEGFAKLSKAEQVAKLQEIVAEVRNYSGSPDFSRRGRVTGTANLLFMFLNARIQGVTADFSRMSGKTGAKEAGVAWARMMTAIGIPALALALVNHSDDELEKDFYQVSDVERENYFMIPTEKFFTNQHGQKVREYYRIPKREIVKLMSNLIEKAVEYAKKDNPFALAEYAAYFLQDIFPVNIQGETVEEVGESVLASTNPLIKAPLEYTLGRNFFFHRDIIPRKLEKVSPALQYTDLTPEVYRKAGEKLGVSPMKLYQLVRSLTAGLFTQFDILEPLPGRSKLSTMPIFKRFFRSAYVDSKDFVDKIRTFQTAGEDQRITLLRQAEDFYEVLKDLPPKEQMAKLKPIKERNKALYNKIEDVIKAEHVGLNWQDRWIKGLGVRNEVRSKFIYSMLREMPQDERSKALAILAAKKVVSKEVMKQIIALTLVGKFKDEVSNKKLLEKTIKELVQA